MPRAAQNKAATPSEALASPWLAQAASDTLPALEFSCWQVLREGSSAHPAPFSALLGSSALPTRHFSVAPQTVFCFAGGENEI